MNARLLIAVSGMLLLAMGVVAVGQGVIDFDSTSYNPAVGEKIMFLLAPEAQAAANGIHYEWYFSGGDKPDITTTDPSVDHAFTVPGYVEVTLKAVGPAGRTQMRRKGLVVGKSALIAVRHVEPQPDGSVVVTITIISGGNLSGVGIEETIPVGWQVSISNSGGVPVKRAGNKLQILWLNQLAPGDTTTFSYQIYPAQGSGIPAFFGTISGYENSKRVLTEICGDLTLPY